MSTLRRCEIFKAVDANWYMVLGNFEYAQADQDCTVYGPFKSQAEAEGELDHHSNPGGMWVDDAGTLPVPPNPRPPSAKEPWIRWS